MNSKDMAVGYALGYNDGLGQGGGSAVVDDWQIPDYWPEIGTPADNEIKLLIIKTSPTATNFKFFTVANFTDNASKISSDNKLTVDWGDGTVDTIITDGNGIVHEYNSGGIIMTNGVQAYVVSIKQNTNDFYYCTDTSSQYRIIAAHIGKNFQLNNSALYSSLLYYVKCYGWQPNEANADVSHQTMFGAYLSRIDMTIPWQYVPPYMFYSKNLISFDGSSLKRIGTYSFANNYYLSKLIAPNLTSIENNAFQNCLRLKKITIAENCEIGTNAFVYCYLLNDPNLNFLSGI